MIWIDIVIRVVMILFISYWLRTGESIFHKYILWGWLSFEVILLCYNLFRQFQVIIVP